MSVTIQRETRAFYDYCLCVPPLKTEWGELSVRRFWLALRGGCVPAGRVAQTFPSHEGGTVIPRQSLRGLCPSMPRPGLNGI